MQNENKKKLPHFDTVSPSKAAGQLLDAFPTVPSNNLTVLPVDVFQLAKDLGIQVEYRDFSPAGSKYRNVDGILLKPTGEEFFIAALNINQSPHQQRFTLAHEIGHWIHKYQDLDMSKFKAHPVGLTEYRNELSAKGTDREEIWANQFAAALLMPAGSVAKAYIAGKTISEMADIYNVSPSAMRNRLENLGVNDTDALL